MNTARQQHAWKRKYAFHRGSLYGHMIFSRRRTEARREQGARGANAEPGAAGQDTRDTHRWEVAEGLREGE